MMSPKRPIGIIKALITSDWAITTQLTVLKLISKSSAIAPSAINVIEKLITDVKSDNPTAANTLHLYGNRPTSSSTTGSVDRDTSLDS